MDQALLDLVNKPLDADEKAEVALTLVDEAKGEVEVKAGAERTRYTLKPLGELYGPGRQTGSYDVKDEHYMPLVMGLEDQIMTYDQTDDSLTDGFVGLALDRLAINPAADPGQDLLSRSLQTRLRMCLSLNDYSKQEVVWALRTIRRSVERHTRSAGIRGYLDFVRWAYKRGARD